MKLSISAAITAITLVTTLFAGTAQASHRERHAVPKSGAGSYAVPHIPTAHRPRATDGYVVSSNSDCRRTVIHRHSGKGPETLVCPAR